MNTRRMNNPPNEPTIDELKTWATPRLLRYFKRHRNCQERGFACEGDKEYEEMLHQHRVRFNAIRDILNSREHVKA